MCLTNVVYRADITLAIVTIAAIAYYAMVIALIPVASWNCSFLAG